MPIPLAGLPPYKSRVIYVQLYWETRSVSFPLPQSLLPMAFSLTKRLRLFIKLVVLAYSLNICR
jgi:hypothetical protein